MTNQEDQASIDLKTQVAVHFRKHDCSKDCLLPQNLPVKILAQLAMEAEAKEQTYAMADVFPMIVGLLLQNEQGQFQAHKDDILRGAQAYATNITLETLLRQGIISVESDFSLGNVLDISFERHVKLTDRGRETAKQMAQADHKLQQ